MLVLVYEGRRRVVMYLYVILNIIEWKVIVKKMNFKFLVKFFVDWIFFFLLIEIIENLKIFKIFDYKFYVVIFFINFCSKEVDCIFNKIDFKNL